MVPAQNEPKNILLALDGSDHSHAALQLVCSLPAVAGCTVKLLSVMIPREASRYNVLEEILKSGKKMLEESGRIAETELVAGYPSEVISERAAQDKPDLTIVGARGLRSALGILLGGVAQQIVEYACCPVMVVRAPFKPIKRVLLVTDGSTSSNNAVEFMSKFPLPEDSKIKVMHVLPPKHMPDLFARSWPVGIETTPPIILSDFENSFSEQAAEEEKIGDKLVKTAVEVLSNAGLAAEPLVLRGDTAEEIINYAREFDVDLIVAGSRGLSQVRGWLLGSVSRKLVHYAPCSTLIMKTSDPLM